MPEYVVTRVETFRLRDPGPAEKLLAWVRDVHGDCGCPESETNEWQVEIVGEDR